MTASRAPAAVDAIIAALTPAAAPSPVWDGPEMTADYRDGIFIGYDGNPVGEQESITITSEWAGLGAKKRTEHFDILCSILAVSGDGKGKDARDRAFNLLAIVETTLRTDPSLAQTPTPFVASVMSPHLLFEWIADLGLQARLTFFIHIETRF